MKEVDIEKDNKFHKFDNILWGRRVACSDTREGKTNGHLKIPTRDIYVCNFGPRKLISNNLIQR